MRPWEHAMKKTGSWHEGTIAWIALVCLLLAVFGWCWFSAWPLARTGHDGAIEYILTSFAAAACIMSGLAAGCKRLGWLFVGAATWSAAVYVASLFLAPTATSHLFGVALRVAAASALSFVSSATYMARWSE